MFASNIVVASGRVATEWQERGIAIAVIVFVTLVHTFTPKAGVLLMNVLSSIKVIILLFIVITGWVVLGGGIKSVPDPHASFRNAFAGSVTAGNPYATALFKVLNSYAGYEADCPTLPPSPPPLPLSRLTRSPGGLMLRTS